MDSQPQNPHPYDTSQKPRQKLNMDKLKKAVRGAMNLDSTTPLSEDAKKYIEKRLLQLFPVIRTPDHPPYAWMILYAIKTLNEKKGSSEESLSEFIHSNYEVPWAHSSYLSHHLCKLARSGDIVVTSDDQYMIPTENPNPKPKVKQQKRKSRKGRGRQGNYHEEAVVEEKDQLGELEKVQIEELNRAGEDENSVIDDHYLIPTENLKPKVNQRKRKSHQSRRSHGDYEEEAVVEEKDQLGEQEKVNIEELSQAGEHENYVVDDHYMIPTENPNPKPKVKQQKWKSHQGKRRHGNYYEEAVVEEKDQLGEQEKVEIQELSQAGEHENYVIDDPYMIPTENPYPKPKVKQQKWKSHQGRRCHGNEEKDQLGEQEKAEIEELSQAGEHENYVIDDHYMIPTENPNPKPKVKQQKWKSHQARRHHGNYHEEAVVEEKDQLGEQEKVEIEELSQAVEHENYVINEAEEQDYKVNEGKDQSQGQQNEVRSELLTSLLDDELSRAQKHENCVIDEAKKQDCQVNECKNESQGQQDELRSELMTSCLDDDGCETLMVVPVESSSPRVEDVALMVIRVESYSPRVEDEEESVEEVRSQQKRSKSSFDALPPLNPQHYSEQQEPQSQHQGTASIPEENPDTGSLLPVGPPQHAPSQPRRRGRPPKPRPVTITKDESLLPLQHESYQQHPPKKRGRGPPKARLGTITKDESLLPLQKESYQLHPPKKRGRGRPRKPGPEAEVTTGDSSISQNVGRGRPPKPKPNPETMIGDFSTSRNVGRGRPPKPKPNPDTTIGGYSTSHNLRQRIRIRFKRKPDFDTTTENFSPLITDSSSQIILID